VRRTRGSPSGLRVGRSSTRKHLAVLRDPSTRRWTIPCCGASTGRAARSPSCAFQGGRPTERGNQRHKAAQAQEGRCALKERSGGGGGGGRAARTGRLGVTTREARALEHVGRRALEGQHSQGSERSRSWAGASPGQGTRRKRRRIVRPRGARDTRRGVRRARTRPGERAARERQHAERPRIRSAYKKKGLGRRARTYTARASHNGRHICNEPSNRLLHM
jgi:hypothetical protein